MFRTLAVVGLVATFCVAACASDISGTYLETRTCQVYTGPCVANAEIGLAGREAIMAWNIEQGKHQGVDLAGLTVVLVIRGSDTLAFNGLADPRELKSVMLVDQKANKSQREALIRFAKDHAGRAVDGVVRVDAAPIKMSLDVDELKGHLEAGSTVKLTTRKVREGDCLCANQSAYYPPLAKVQNFVPGVTIEGEFAGRGLGTRWSTVGDPSAYMGMFAY